MPFPKAPHPALRQWDHNACDSAVVAQILWMGGRLQYPFDTARFDRVIKREPGQPTANMEGVRFIARQLPITLFSVDSVPVEEYADPVKIRAALRKVGHYDADIDEYLSGPYFKMNQVRVQDALRLEAELGNRFRKTIGPHCGQHLRGYLAQGAVIVASYNVTASAPRATGQLTEDGGG